VNNITRRSIKKEKNGKMERKTRKRDKKAKQ
jgi:hypothetical protein